MPHQQGPRPVPLKRKLQGYVWCPGGRDVAFYRDGDIAIYVCPMEEGGLIVEDVRDAVADWKARLAVPGNEAQLDDFFGDA